MKKILGRKPVGTQVNLSDPKLESDKVSSLKSRLKLNAPWIVLGLASIHLILVCGGAASIDLSPLGPLAPPIFAYGQASGANSSYAFFSPGISSQVRVRFILKKDPQTTETVDLLTNENREIDLRISNIFDQFLAIEASQRQNSDSLRRLLAASLAGKMLSRYPDVQSIAVSLQEYIPMSLDAPLVQAPPQWTTVYDIEFANARGGNK